MYKYIGFATLSMILCFGAGVYAADEKMPGTSSPQVGSGGGVQQTGPPPAMMEQKQGAAGETVTPGMQPQKDIQTPLPPAQPLDPALSSGQTAGAQTVKGELLKIEGENYVVKDASGMEIRLHVSKETKAESLPQVGDKIEAQVTAEGHATETKKADADGAASSGSSLGHRIK